MQDMTHGSGKSATKGALDAAKDKFDEIRQPDDGDGEAADGEEEPAEQPRKRRRTERQS
jgi:hypothetical protein